MSQANPLEVPGTEVVRPMLESLQCQITATNKLLSLLRANGDESVRAGVEEQLTLAETYVKRAAECMAGQLSQPTREVSPTILWLAASPSEDRQQQGARLTLRERGEILSRAIDARKLNSDTVISAEHDPVDTQWH